MAAPAESVERARGAGPVVDASAKTGDDAEQRRMKVARRLGSIDGIETSRGAAVGCRVSAFLLDSSDHGACHYTRYAAFFTFLAVLDGPDRGAGGPYIAPSFAAVCALLRRSSGRPTTSPSAPRFRISPAA